ncbi:MAG TPA: hypothetical protein VKX16_13110 [Chloroflexota bacterium]|nr:hypothetical protein [Chloroflexota bacterium]
MAAIAEVAGASVERRSQAGARPTPGGTRWLTPGALAAPLAVLAVTRAALAVLAWRAHVLLPPPRRHPNLSVLPHTDPLSAIWSWASPWFRFDAAWYVGIVQHGYRWGSLGHANTNFMPLYPALARAVQPLALDSPWLAAWLVANLSYGVALVLLWQWACLKWDRPIAWRVLLLSATFPFAFFFAAPYGEALFLALATAAFLFAELDRWPLAIGAAALCTVTRPVGLAVVAGVLVTALSRGRRRPALWTSAAVLPLAGFIAYLTVAFRQPMGFLTYHSAGWVAPRGDLLTTVRIQFATHLAPFDRIDALCAAGFIALGVACWKRIGPGYSVYVLGGVLLPLAHGLVSMERYVAVLFPAIAVVATWDNRGVQRVAFIVSLLGATLFTLLFCSGYAVF